MSIGHVSSSSPSAISLQTQQPKHQADNDGDRDQGIESAAENSSEAAAPLTNNSNRGQNINIKV